jgi:hypothetical protein
MNARSLQMTEGMFHPHGLLHDVCAFCFLENYGMFDAI